MSEMKDYGNIDNLVEEPKKLLRPFKEKLKRGLHNLLFDGTILSVAYFNGLVAMAALESGRYVEAIIPNAFNVCFGIALAKNHVSRKNSYMPHF